MRGCGTRFRGEYAVSIDTIKAGLEASIDALVAKLLPGAIQDGDEWMIGSVAGEAGRSMAINRKARAGIWKDFAADMKGDALDLVAAVLFRGDKTEAIKWSKSWLGLDGQDPERIKQFRLRAEETATKNKADRAEQDQRMLDTAGRIWRGATHRIGGTVADRYLVGRAIDLAAIGRQPGSLAFLEQAWCSEVKAKMPAMLAEIVRGTKFVGIHRTYLEQLGDGSVRKAVLEEPKKTMGRYLGGCIPLWRGADPRKWRELWASEEPETVVLAEGIENALSVLMADQSHRIAATVSLANMAAVELPRCVKEVIIARDNDALGSDADKAFKKVIAAHRGAGRTVREARAPAPFKDFNDWLVALRAEERQSQPGGTDGRQS